MAAADLSIIYRRYIDTLNARDVDSLAHFVHPQAIHNGNVLGLSGYQNMIRDNIATFPDLMFNLETLVVSNDHVAARIRFDCTPVKPFLGLPPNGKKVTFTEHVFYQFESDRIKQVWSLLDYAALQEQLKPAQT